jgi:hypothetical protein
VTGVFFLFFLHASLGLMAALAFVPDRAGVKFFKLCAASAAFMTMAGLWLVVRLDGAMSWLVWTSGAFLVLVMLYNRPTRRCSTRRSPAGSRRWSSPTATRGSASCSSRPTSRRRCSWARRRAP